MNALIVSVPCRHIYDTLASKYRRNLRQTTSHSNADNTTMSFNPTYQNVLNFAIISEIAHTINY